MRSLLAQPALHRGIQAKYGKSCTSAYRGRTALAEGCKALGLQEGDEVLVPSYNCGMEVDVLHWLKYRIVLYRVDQNLQLDFEDLKNKATPRTRALYVIHYFGCEQEQIHLAEWCAANQLFLIEDCALSLFSEGKNGLLGTSGDLSILSFSKSLPCPDGGAFLLNRREASLVSARSAPPLSLLMRNLLGVVKKPAWKRALRPKARYSSPAGNAWPPMPASYYFRQSEMNWGPSRAARNVASRVQPERIVATRRANYEHLRDLLRGNSAVRPLLGQLGPRACPLCMPLVVQNRDAAWSALNERGVEAGRWWAGYHKDLPWSGFPEACFLKNSVLTLPVHQDLNDEQIRYIGEAVNGAIN